MRERVDFPAIVGATVLAIVFVSAIMAMNLEFIGGDQFRWFPLIDDWMRGDFQLGALFEPHGGHRAAGYKLVFLLNAELFHLNFTAEKLLAAAAITASSYYFLGHLSRSGFIDVQGSSRAAAIAVIVGAYVCSGFLLVNPAVLNTVANYSVISMRVFNFAGFLLIFCLVSNHLNRAENWARFAAILLFLLIFSNFFGRAWSMVMLVAVIMSIIASDVIRTIETRRLAIRPSNVGLLLYCLVMMALYYSSVAGEEPAESAFSIVELVKFVAVIMSRSLTVMFRQSEFWSNDALGHHIALGLGVLTLYAVATVSYFALRMHRKSWVPILLMAYSVGSACLVYVGRALTESDAGDVLPMAFFPRFLFDCSVGHVGVVLVLVAAICRVFARQVVLQRAMVACVLGAAFAIGLVNLMAFSEAAPRVQRYAHGMNEIFFDPEADFSDLAYARRARCHSEELCVRAREIVLRYELLRAERRALEEN